jgi:phosphatidylglycerophosphatase A
MGFWHPAYLIATGFGIGKLPFAPGTWGSLAALPVAYYLQVSGGSGALLIAFLIVLVIGTWASGVVELALESDDPGEIIVDEIAGQWLAVLFLPPDWALYAVAFVLFRIFDIFKPWPVDHLDTHGTGGVGIMQDDMAAGLYAMLVLHTFLFVVSNFMGASA